MAVFLQVEECPAVYSAQGRVLIDPEIMEKNGIKVDDAVEIETNSGRSVLARVGKPQTLIRHVTDRPGHDRRYAIDAGKIIRELGWQPSVTFEEGIARTIDWYLGNGPWLANVVSGAYQQYYERMYANR